MATGDLVYGHNHYSTAATPVETLTPQQRGELLSISRVMLERTLQTGILSIRVRGDREPYQDECAERYKAFVEETQADFIEGHHYSSLLRVVVNPTLVSARRASRRLPADTYHPDSVTTPRKDGKLLIGRAADKRRLLVVNGAGTGAISGSVTVPEAIRFSPAEFDATTDADVVELMQRYPQALIGDDGTLVKGPAVPSARETGFEGDFQVHTLNTDTIYNLHPDTLHITPDELTRGRILSLTDREPLPSPTGA